MPGAIRLDYPHEMKRESTIIAVVSGKGGVGKSLLTVNLAETLAAEGMRVAVVDVDLGQCACAVLMNESPDASVMDLIRFMATTATVKHASSSGITLVQAATEPGEAAARAKDLWPSLDELLNDLRDTHDYVLIDTPAGTEGAVRWALDRADLGILVVVGEPTAIADAYRLARSIWKSDPTYPLATVVNFAESAEDAESVAVRFGKITEHFTGRLPNYLGWVPFSPEVRASVRMQRPVVRDPGLVRDAFAGIGKTLVSGRDRTPTVLRTI